MPHPRKYDDGDPVLGEVRKLVAELPATAEVEAWGKPTFRVQAGKTQPMFAVYGAHKPGPNSATEFQVPQALILKPDPAEREALAEDDRFFAPAYYAARGWIAVDLAGGGMDWTEAAELLEDAYRLVAPKKLIAELEQRKK